jgi:hypothetical protein
MRASARARPSAPAISTALIRHARAGRPKGRQSRRKPPTGRRRSPRGASVVKARTPMQSTYIRALSVRPRLRHRPGRHRQDLSRGGLAAQLLERGAGRAHHPVASRRRGRRAAGLPAGRHAREGRSLSAPALRRALRRAAAREGRARSRDRRDRDRAAGLHARPHAGQRRVILDEAQNTTSMQMKMFLTRLGENSKMVVTGDPSQIDLPPGRPPASTRRSAARWRRGHRGRALHRRPTSCAYAKLIGHVRQDCRGDGDYDPANFKPISGSSGDSPRLIEP